MKNLKFFKVHVIRIERPLKIIKKIDRMLHLRIHKFIMYLKTEFSKKIEFSLKISKTFPFINFF